MKVEYITIVPYSIIPKGTIFTPIGQTNKEFKFYLESSENIYTVPKEVCEINFGEKLDRNNREDIEMLEESRTQGLENED